MFSPKFDFDSRSTDADLSLQERADRYVDRVEAFYVHAATYVGVNVLLVGINLLTSPEVFWAVWPILGWGVKLGAHGVSVFGLPGRDAWRERIRRSFLRRHGRGDHVSGMRGAEHPRASGDEIERLRRRVENLETIVTSADWELVVEATGEGETQPTRVDALAKDVVHE